MNPTIVLNDGKHITDYVKEVEGELPSPRAVSETLRRVVRDGVEDPTTTALELLRIERHPRSAERE